jgi:competence protein ComFC
MLALILNLLYPKFCVNCHRFGSYLCADCQDRIEFLQLQYCPGCKFVSKRGLIHKWCRAKSRLDGTQSLTHYKGPIRKLIHFVKYKHSYSLVADVLPQFLKNVSLEFDPDMVIVPIPLSKERLQLRGFNQSEVIATVLAKTFGEKVSLNVLTRVKNTTTQTSLTRADRILNLKDAFSARETVKGKSFLLVDDVWTTGSTLNEAAKELKRKGAKRVYAFTVAVGK